METSTLSTRCLARPGLYGFELGVLNTEQVRGEIWQIGDFITVDPPVKEENDQISPLQILKTCLSITRVFLTIKIWGYHGIQWNTMEYNGI